MAGFFDNTIDGLTSIDEKLAQLNDNVRSLAEQNKTTARLESGLPRNKKSIDLTKAVPGNTETEEVEEIPFDGFVDGVIVGWPDGADLVVGIRIDNNETGQKYFPGGGDDYAAFNDFNHVFPVTFPVEKGDEIAANFKSNKSYTVGITATLQAYEKLPGETMDEIRERLG